MPKFTKTLDELKSSLDVWLYFLRHADKIDTEAVPAALGQQPMVMRALEELKMLTQTDLERERYEARRKVQLDYNTDLKEARMDGHAEGTVEALQNTVLRQGQRRFGEPTEQATAVVKGITDQVQLERLTDRLLEVGSWQELLEMA